MSAGRAVTLAAVAALAWVAIARIAAPSDLWHQSQPRTVSYTTDIVVHGGSRWVLPRFHGDEPATKPPLYNWVAAPGVRLAGFHREAAHKLPSLVALVGCWLLVLRAGRLVAPGRDGLVGGLAGLAFVTNWTIFKLGYLARPDMLLCLWLLIAWLLATELLRSDPAAGRPGRRRLAQAAFWLAVGLAGLTKGPAALVAPLYGLVAAPALAGGWRGTGRLGWAWGLPLAGGLVAAWVTAAYRVDPEHVRQVLWHDEIWGRLTGTGPEGSRAGLRGWVTDLPDLALLFLVRFAPWSAATVAAMVVLWRRAADGSGRAWRGLGPETGARLHGAALFVVVVLAVFTLSAGKRADYMAPALAPAALLAAWWIAEHGGRPAVAAAMAAAVVALSALTVHVVRAPEAPAPAYGRGIARFVDEAAAATAADPGPIAFMGCGGTHLEAMLGHSGPVECDATRDLQRAGRPFWLVGGGVWTDREVLEAWLGQHPGRWVAQPVVVSADLPESHWWVGRVVLHRVGRRPDSSGDSAGSDNP
ncbi:MAG: ArnT family glycosyltransferase [Planctomycetota bacterium]|jgi:4-amino-4-deoxy-L-arabinose transferase-like glycosyltransferase